MAQTGTRRKIVVLASADPIVMSSLRAAFDAAGVRASFRTHTETRALPCALGPEAMMGAALDSITAAALSSPGADFYVGLQSGLIVRNRRNESGELAQDWFMTSRVLIFARGVYGSALTNYYFIPVWMGERAAERRVSVSEIIKERTGVARDPIEFLSNGTVSPGLLLNVAMQVALAQARYPDRYREPQ